MNNATPTGGEPSLEQKISVLKKAYIEEKNKTESLKKEINQYKEELLYSKDKINSLQASLDDMRSIINQQNVNEDNNDNGDDAYVNEINELKQRINELVKEKQIVNDKLNETLEMINTIKDNARKQMDQARNEIKNEYQNQINKLTYELELTKTSLEQETNKAVVTTELCRKHETEMIQKDKQINELQIANENLNKQIQSIIEDNKQQITNIQHAFNKQLLDQNKDATIMKTQIKELTGEDYDDLKALSEEGFKYVFKGRIVISRKKGLYEDIEICFGKVKDHLWVKEHNEEYLVANGNMEVKKHSKYKNRVWIIIGQGKSKDRYIECEFTPKKVKCILDYFEQIKVNGSFNEQVFNSIKLGNYFY